VQCSSGTYVRSLAADLGRALGGGAHLRGLRRTAIGSFSVDEAAPIESISDASVLPPAVAMRDLASVCVDADVAAAVHNGKVLPADVLIGGIGDGPWAVLDEAGELLAVYEPHRDGTVKPAVVLAR
jgi:tRNA pseudouridine55 synthase